MAAEVTSILGNPPKIRIPPPEQWLEPSPGSIWANYDEETDSFIVYFTEKPVKGINVRLSGEWFVIVEPSHQQVVGMYVEAWERSVVKSDAKLGEMWPYVRESLIPETGWSQLLRAFGFYLSKSIPMPLAGANHLPLPA